MDGLNSETLETIMAYQELEMSESFSSDGSLDLAMNHAHDGDDVRNQVEDAAEDGPIEPAVADDHLDTQCDGTEESFNEYDCESEFRSQDSEQGDQVAEESYPRTVNDIIFESTISTEVDTVDVNHTSSAYQDIELPSTPLPPDGINDSAAHGNVATSNNSVDVSAMDTTGCDLSTGIGKDFDSEIPGETSVITYDGLDSTLPLSGEDHRNHVACDGGSVTNVLEAGTMHTSQTEPNQLSLMDTEVAATNDQADIVASPTQSTITDEINGTVERPIEVSTTASTVGESIERMSDSGSGPAAEQLGTPVTRETQIDAPQAKSPLDFMTAKETKVKNEFHIGVDIFINMT
ncbi:hypothetical protein V1509DRAFT_567397 [Lipomyces kononenkoae]